MSVLPRFDCGVSYVVAAVDLSDLFFPLWRVFYTNAN
jgi:hypothetical protein